MELHGTLTFPNSISPVGKCPVCSVTLRSQSAITRYLPQNFKVSDQYPSKVVGHESFAYRLEPMSSLVKFIGEVLWYSTEAQRVPKLLLCMKRLKIIFLKLLWHLPRSNGLKHYSKAVNTRSTTRFHKISSDFICSKLLKVWRNFVQRRHYRACWYAGTSADTLMTKFGTWKLKVFFLLDISPWCAFATVVPILESRNFTRSLTLESPELSRDLGEH